MALIGLASAVACKTLDEPDYFAGSINALEGNDVPVTTINTAAQGMPILARDVQSGMVVAWGEVGREGYSLDPANPDNNTRRLVLLDRGISSGTWTSAYQVMRQGSVILGAVGRAAVGMTDQQKEGIRGWVKTIEAQSLMIIAEIFDQSGAALDVNANVDDPLPAIVPRAQVYARVLSLLDEAKVHLLAAGGTFSFVPSAGFASFNTPAGLLKVNRAIRARVNVLLGNHAAALQDLTESFVSPTAAMNLGAFHSYSALSGDIVNPLFDPVPRTLVVHPSFNTDAQLRADLTPDLRATEKTALILVNGVPGERVLNNITVTRRWNIYRSSADPVPIIKNEELLLLRAEATLACALANPTTCTGDRVAALADVNTVRVNSGGLAVIADPGVGGAQTGDRLLDEILYNRRYSLVWEGGHRWLDMRRYGILAQLPRARAGDKVFPYAPLPDNECIPRDPDPAGCTVPAVIN
jgi:starch-binding outer membrane protein, SusD/RagB family